MSLQSTVRADTWSIIVATGRRITVEFETVPVYGYTGNISKDKSLTFAGMIRDYRKSCWIEADAYDPMPAPNERVTVDSTVYLILNTEEDAVGGFTRLDLGDKDT